MTEETEKKPTRARATKVEEAPPMNIYQRIAAISRAAGALAPEAKGGVPFAFRGIDGTVAHLSGLLNQYEVFAVPQIQSHIITEREAGNNRIVKTAQVEVKYIFFGPDGDSVEVTTPGLADDFADRASAQAMSVAFRIALLQLFHLPTHTREPEETGEDVLQNRGAAASNAPAALQKANAVKAGGADTLLQLQTKAKALGKNLGLEVAELNAMGAELSGGESPEVWFVDSVVMGKLVKALETKAKG